VLKESKQEKEGIMSNLSTSISRVRDQGARDILLDRAEVQARLSNLSAVSDVKSLMDQYESDIYDMLFHLKDTEIFDPATRANVGYRHPLFTDIRSGLHGSIDPEYVDPDDLHGGHSPGGW